MSLVALAASASGAEPSPQSTLIVETVPSESVEVNVAVTICPVLAGFGETLIMVTTGGRSFTVSEVIPEPGPALLVAVTVIVNVWDITFPVDE